MYKVSFYFPKIKFSWSGSALAKEGSPELDTYINNFANESWELVSTTFIIAAGIMFIWEKK